MQKFIRLPEVKNRTGLSKTTIYEYIQAGWFPASIQIGIRAVGWDSKEIDEWIAQRISDAKKVSP
jgi:prophage regulatory protein